MDLINSIILFFLIALIWTTIVYTAYKKATGKKVKKRDRKMLFGGLLLFLAFAGIIFIGVAVYEQIESPKFCGTTCHIMEPFYESYIHPGNNSMMATHEENDITCSNCHDKPRIDGKLYSLSLALPEAIIYFTNSYDTDDLGGHVERDACLKCHDGDHAIVPKNVTTAVDTDAFPHDSKDECVDCHDPHLKGIGLTDDTCSICHGTTLSDFPDKLEKHEDRTDEECMDCHNRDHPEDARVPYSEVSDIINNEFCSDCHETQYNEYTTSWTDELKSRYGNCTSSCHTEHKESEAPHQMDPPFEDNCNKCHLEGFESHKIVDKSYSNFIDDIENEYCSSCHEDEYNTYTTSNTGRCVDCHTDHQIKPEPDHSVESPYDECSTCHTDLPGKHNLTFVTFSEFPPTDIDNDFCADCHSDEFDRLEDAIHSSRECVDCHYEHGKLQVQFDICKTCHSNVPDSHDEDRIGCDDCHNTSKIHSEVN
jgi:hypothetical protein